MTVQESQGGVCFSFSNSECCSVTYTLMKHFMELSSWMRQTDSSVCDLLHFIEKIWSTTPYGMIWDMWTYWWVLTLSCCSLWYGYRKSSWWLVSFFLWASWQNIVHCCRTCWLLHISSGTVPSLSWLMVSPWVILSAQWSRTSIWIGLKEWQYNAMPVSYTHLDVYKRQVQT